MDHLQELKEVCKSCGLTRGAHCGMGYYSKHYKRYIPYNTCPRHQGRMDWDKEPYTVFVPTGEFKDVPDGTAAKGVNDD